MTGKRQEDGYRSFLLYMVTHSLSLPASRLRGQGFLSLVNEGAKFALLFS